MTENGVPVSGLSVVREGASTQSRSAVVLAIDESLTMKGRPIADAFAAARRVRRAGERRTRRSRSSRSTARSTSLQPFTYSASADRLGARAAPTARLRDEELRRARSSALALIEAANVAGRRDHHPHRRPERRQHGRKPRHGARARLAAAHVRVFSVGLASPAFNACRARSRWRRATGGSYVTRLERRAS